MNKPANTLVYFGGVVLLQRLVGWLTGQQESPLAIVASTLAIVALFNSLRRRIQGFIDRRCYRRKYADAERRQRLLRVETDLERVPADLLAVVEEWRQPAHAPRWPHPPGRRAQSIPHATAPRQPGARNAPRNDPVTDVH